MLILFPSRQAVTHFLPSEPAEVVEAANNTTYGLGCNVFTENLSRAIRVINTPEAGSAWICCRETLEMGVPSNRKAVVRC